MKGGCAGWLRWLKHARAHQRSARGNRGGGGFQLRTFARAQGYRWYSTAHCDLSVMKVSHSTSSNETVHWSWLCLGRFSAWSGKRQRIQAYRTSFGPTCCGSQSPRSPDKHCTGAEQLRLFDGVHVNHSQLSWVPPQGSEKLLDNGRKISP